jgi:hypothetical protein
MDWVHSAHCRLPAPVTGQLLTSQRLVFQKLVDPRLARRISKRTKILIAVNWSPGRYLNPRPSAYKAECYPLGCCVRVCVLRRQIGSLSIRTVNSERSQYAISALVFSHTSRVCLSV